MESKKLRRALLGSWTHVHEQDQDDEQVYVSPTVEVPPARGRRGFTLADGGVLRESGPGADDRTTINTGQWKLKGRRLDLIPDEGEASHYVIKEIGTDRLVLQRAPEPNNDL
jgi:hypothetical protein